VEDREQRELLTAVLAEIKTAPGPVHFVDLHTSSADGPPFVTVGDTLRNRAFALALGLPVVLGLEEQVEGALLEYVNNLGHVTAGVEAGRHDAPSSVDRHESVLWLALAAAGLLRPEDVPDLAGHRRRLAEAAPGVPPVLEVRHRHPVRPEDRFVMTPGLRNFDPVPARFELARDRRGPVVARRRCRVLLPLYQAQGDDGFFLVFPVRPFWLRLSGWLRRAGFPRLVAALPGVRAVPERLGEYRVDTRIARFFPLQILHLLGFRKLRRDGRWLTVSRRREEPPPGPGGPSRPPG
jgi:succinylglutamate desuccinylase